jgi:uncharacterized membrane protein required for colicin V production
MFLAYFTLGSVVDVIAGIIAILFVIRGLTCGATVEIARLFGFFGGVYSGTLLFPKIYAGMIAVRGSATVAAVALSALILTIVFAFAIGILTRYAGVRILQIVIFQPADALLGMAAGLVYAVVIITVIYAFGMLLPYKPAQTVFIEQSSIGRLVCPWLKVHMGLT